MCNRSCVVVCFASLLALAELSAQTQPQSVAAAAVAQQPATGPLQGSVPRLIRFSGTLSPADVKQGGLVGVEFAIYREESGGVALWSEIQNVEADSSGHFTVLLGSTTNGGLPPDVLGIGEQRWLSVAAVGGVAQPRALLVSVPYALRAEEALRIAGAPAADFVRKGDLTDSVREAMHTIQSDPNTKPANPNATSNASSGPTTFSGTTTTGQIVLVQQLGTAKALVATAASGIGTTSTGGTVGVYGSASAAKGIGVEGIATAATGTGVHGAGVIAGVYGSASAATGIGVQGVATDKTSGASTGVSGISASPAGTGVSGQGSAFGVTGIAANAGGIGVKGTSTDVSNITGIDFGVQGIAGNSTGAGVNGVNTALTGNAFGVLGSSSSTSTNAAAISGIEGAATGQVFGVNGSTNSPNGAGVHGFNNATTGAATGVQGNTSSPTGAAVVGSNNAITGPARGVEGDTSSPGGAGVHGFNNATDTTTGPANGVEGDSVNGNGVAGNAQATTGQVFGVAGNTASTGNGSAGVSGFESATSGNVFGVNGGSQSPNGIGVNGNNSAASGPTIGVQGSSVSPQGYGVSGTSPNVAVAGFNQNCNSNGCTLATGIGGQFFTGVGGTLLQGLSGPSFSSLTSVFTVDGTGKGTFNGGVSSTINNPSSNVIVGTNNATSGSAASIVGTTYSTGQAAAIAGFSYSSSSTGGAVYGESHSASGSAISGSNMGGGLAGSFSGGVQVTGNLNVTGTITAGTKDFKIDDPIDPERKFLYHASIESWEMANLYSGNVVLDRRGEAVVDLPEWFEALNGDFRYQLTTIGRAAAVYIAKEIENHQFKIAGGRAGMKVSWQVTGVRHDAWAQQHPLQVEEEKPAH